MKQGGIFRVAVAVLALVTEGTTFGAVDDAMLAEMDAGWTRVKTVFSCERTKNIYATPLKDCEPLSNYADGLLIDRKRYPRGIEDCPIMGGIALSMFVDRYAVTGEESLKAEARWVAEGVRNLVMAHRYPGYVARGLHPEDGRSIGALSSRDQVTHVAHGLWRWAKSPLASASDKELAATIMASVADLMLKRVTADTDWNFGCADGSKDMRGVCKMRAVRPHEAARLASVYAAAYALTDNEKYEKALSETLPEALRDSERIVKMSANDLKSGVPDYALLQMSSSLEVLLGTVKDAEARERIVALLKISARLASERNAEGVRYCPWLCGAAERPLVELMVPGEAPSKATEASLLKELQSRPFAKSGSTRIVEMSAAYWRYRQKLSR